MIRTLFGILFNQLILRTRLNVLSTDIRELSDSDEIRIRKQQTKAEK
jgi:hypothetical protein